MKFFVFGTENKKMNFEIKDNQSKIVPMSASHYLSGDLPTGPTGYTNNHLTSNLTNHLTNTIRYSSPLSGQSHNVFISGQQTKLMLEKIKMLNKSTIRTSFPPFNNLHLPEWDDEKKDDLDLPCYGTRIPVEIYELFNTKALHRELKNLQVDLHWRVDPFVLGMAKERIPLLANEIVKLTGNTTSATKLMNFVTKLLNESREVSSKPEWNQFIASCGIPDDWEEKLHFNSVLTLFGCSEEESKIILQAELNKTGKLSSVQNYCVRWLSKALTAFQLNGCLVDVVNLIFAMLGLSTYKHNREPWTEQDVVDKIKSFRHTIDLGNPTSILWIPQFFLHDAEKDDMLCWALLLALKNRSQGYHRLITMVQLPTEPIFDQLEDRFRKVPGTLVFRDSQSRNQSALKAVHGLVE